MLVFFFLVSLFALPNAQHTEYLHRISTPNRPVVLVLISPGWSEQKLSALFEHLWLEGFSVWFLRFEAHAQDEESMKQSLKEAVQTHEKPILVAHGLSSIFMLSSIQDLRNEVSAIALLGAPIQPWCSPNLMDALQNNNWSAYPDLPLQFASPTFHKEVYKWCSQKTITPPKLDWANIWAATTNVDSIAPPESIRPYLDTHHRFVRSGPLSLHGKEPNHIELAIHPNTLRDLSRWLWRQKPWNKP